MPPSEILLPEIGLRFTPLMFAYGMDAMPEGLRIAEKVYPRGLRAAVAMAARAVGANGQDQHWDLIRPDLGAARDFETALYLRRGLGASFPMVAVPAQVDSSRDYVTQFSLSALPSDEVATFAKFLTPDEREVSRRATLEFLTSFRSITAGQSASGEKPVTLPTGEAGLAAMRESAKLATSLEMAGAKGPPLAVLFGQKAGGNDIGKLVRSGLKVIAGRWLLANPGPLGDIQGWFPIQYISQLSPGSRQILVGHDTQLFFILRALGMISLGNDFSDGPVLPMESAIFAFHGDKVAVVRLQLQLTRDGSAGAFEPWLVWQGTRAEWDARVAALRKRLESHPATARLLRTYRQAEPVVLKIDQQ